MNETGANSRNDSHGHAPPGQLPAADAVSSGASRGSRPSDAYWLVAIPICALMFYLATRGGVRHVPAFGAATIAGCLLVLCACWRLFEYLLWLRFPTAKQHTVAAKVATGVVLVVFAVQVVLLIVK